MTTQSNSEISPLAEVIQVGVSAALKNTHTMLPGVIVDYDEATQRAKVQLGQGLEKINGVRVPYPILLDVPVQFPRWGAFSITMPVGAGDECAVCFFEQDISRFLSDGQSDLPPVTARRFDLSDGFAVMGLFSSGQALADVPTDAIQIRADEGTVLTLTEDGKFSVENSGEELVSLLSEILQQLSVETVTVAGTPTPLNGAATYAALKVRLDTFKVSP